jgi:hypothetical protein
VSSSGLSRFGSKSSGVFERVATTEGVAAWFTEELSPDYRSGGTIA